MNDNTFKAAVIVAIGSGAVGFFGSLGFACLYMLATFNGAN